MGKFKLYVSNNLPTTVENAIYGPFICENSSYEANKHRVEEKVRLYSYFKDRSGDITYIYASDTDVVYVDKDGNASKYNSKDKQIMRVKVYDTYSQYFVIDKVFTINSNGKTEYVYDAEREKTFIKYFKEGIKMALKDHFISYDEEMYQTFLYISWCNADAEDIFNRIEDLIPYECIINAPDYIKKG